MSTAEYLRASGDPGCLVDWQIKGTGEDVDGCEQQHHSDPINYFAGRHDLSMSRDEVRALSDTALQVVVVDSNLLPCNYCLETDVVGSDGVARQIHQTVTVALEEQLRRNRVRDLGEPEQYQLLARAVVGVSAWWRKHHRKPFPSSQPVPPPDCFRD